MRDAPALLVVFSLGAATAAGAREVRTGTSTDIAVGAARRYASVFWVEPRSDGEVEIVALPAPAELAEELDVVDERGFVARVKIVSLEPAACGKLSYARARARASWPGLGRELIGGVVALGPARGRPSRARVLPPDEHGDHRPGRTLIDVDGDGSADLARQVSLECAAEKGKTLACLETWAREAGTWRRLARAEIGPCG